MKSGTSELARGVGKIALAYLAFGGAYMLLMIAYCTYRASMGNPSDLPCVSLVWNSIELLGWPLFALGNVLNGRAVQVPSILVRATGMLFLGGFLATFWWMFRSPSRAPR